MDDFHCDKVEIIAATKAHVDMLLREVATQDKKDEKLRVEFKGDLQGAKQELKEDFDRRVVGMWKFVSLLISAVAIAGQVMVYLVKHAPCVSNSLP